jgi:hypothetical protein
MWYNFITRGMLMLKKNKKKTHAFVFTQFENNVLHFSFESDATHKTTLFARVELELYSLLHYTTYKARLFLYD